MMGERRQPGRQPRREQAKREGEVGSRVHSPDCGRGIKNAYVRKARVEDTMTFTTMGAKENYGGKTGIGKRDRLRTEHIDSRC